MAVADATRTAVPVPDMAMTLRVFAAVQRDRTGAGGALAAHVARELEAGRSLFDVVMDPGVQARLGRAA
jgi:hypothetical protein